MSTVLLIWYALGWALVAVACRDHYEDELTLAMLLTAILLWPVGLMLIIFNHCRRDICEIVVWRKP